MSVLADMASRVRAHCNVMKPRLSRKAALVVAFTGVASWGILTGACASGASRTDAPVELLAVPTRGNEAKLLFKSGFEEGVVLTPPILRFGQWRQELRGGDQGYSWNSALPGAPTDFQYLVSDGDAADVTQLQRFVETRIDTVPGHDGKSTRSLYQAMRADGSIGRTQNDFILFNLANPESGYVRYWIRLQPNLLDLMRDEGDWRVLFEWKEAPSSAPPTGLDFQYRWLVMISRRKPDKESPVDGLAWKLEGDAIAPDQAAKGTPWTDEWTIWNRQVPVPLGEWFSFEVSWKLAMGDEGRVLVKANGRVIAERRGRTQQEWPRGKLYTFMTYTATTVVARGESYQWVDDFELWSEEPRR